MQDEAPDGCGKQPPYARPSAELWDSVLEGVGAQ